MKGRIMTQRDLAVNALRAALSAQRAMEKTVAIQVAACRTAGVGWQEIADEAGTSKPTAMKRWAEDDETRDFTSKEFDMEPGQTIRRADLHDRWGGNRQTGISAPREGENIFLFTGEGDRYGYHDEELKEGLFQYNGEGLDRNHEMDRGNRAILTHAEKGRRLRLFRKAGTGLVEYVGEYAYRSHKTEPRPGGHGGQLHEHIVFVLEPVGWHAPRSMNGAESYG
jgi:hypothetical protein